MPNRGGAQTPKTVFIPNDIINEASLPNVFLKRAAAVFRTNPKRVFRDTKGSKTYYSKVVLPIFVPWLPREKPHSVVLRSSTGATLVALHIVRIHDFLKYSEIVVALTEYESAVFAEEMHRRRDP